MAKIEKVWKELDCDHPMNAVFYEDLIQLAYSEDVSMAKIIGYLSVPAIVIASKDLLGMVVFLWKSRYAKYASERYLVLGRESCSSEHL